MLQPGNGPNLGVKAADNAFVLIVGRRQDLDGNRFSQTDVFGLEHDTHRAGAQAFEHAIIVDDESERFARADAIGLKGS